MGNVAIGRMRSLTVERIESEPALRALEQAWVELEARSGNTLPFRTYAWVSTWWKHMRADRPTVRDSLAFRAVRSSDQRLVAVAPFIRTERPAIGPLRVSCLQFIGADPNVTEIRGVLCEPSLASACYEVIHRDVAGTADWIRWTGIEAEAAQALDSAKGRRGEGLSCFVLDLPDTWPEFVSTRPRNIKESLRKCRNSLKRDGLAASLEVVSVEADVPSALRDFFRLHARRAELPGTVEHKNVFAYPICRAFLEEACKRFAAAGALRIFRLRLGDLTVATRIGFALGGSLYLYYSGFEPAFAKYGVMTTTLADAIRYALREGMRSVNLSSGSDISKSRWRPREIPYGETLIVSPRGLSRAKYSATRAAQRAVTRFQDAPMLQQAWRLLGRRREKPTAG